MTATTLPMDLPLEHLEPSPLQYRRTINEAALAELAVDLKARGVLQRIRARPNPDGALRPYQLVYGHRRFAAAQLAGLATIPADVCAMTDEEVRLAQIAENMDREDVHPIEEGEGFQALITDCGYTRERIAAEYGKSLSYVTGRLRLLDAVPEVRQACLKGEIGSEVALLIARLRTPDLQVKAIKAINDELGHGGVGITDAAKTAQASYRDIKDLLRRKFTLNLRNAPFDTEDIALLPDTPACGPCPKRAGNAPEFADLCEYKNLVDQGKPDTCTDPECYAAKSAAARAVKVAELEAKGKTVLTEKQTAKAFSAYGGLNKAAYVPLADVKDQLKQAKTAGHAPQVLTLIDPQSQKPVDVVKTADLKAAGVQNERDKQAARDAAKKAKLTDQLAARTEANQQLLRTVHDALAGRPITVDALRIVADRVVEVAYEWDGGALIDALYGWTDQPSTREALARTADFDAGELTRLIVVCCLTDHIECFRLEQQPEALHKVARSLGIDPAQASAPAPAEAAPAKKKGKAAKGEESAA